MSPEPTPDPPVSPNRPEATVSVPSPILPVYDNDAVQAQSGLSDTTPHMSETLKQEHWLHLLIVVATCLLLALALAVVIRLLSSIGHTLLLFSLGGLLAYALDPLVERARGAKSARPRPRWVGVAIVFGSLGVLALAGSVLLSHEAGRQVGALAHNHGELEARGRAEIARIDDWLQTRGLNVRIGQYLDHPPPDAKTWGQSVAKNAVHLLERVSASLVESIIVLLIALYFLIYSSEMRHKLLDSLPPRVQPYAAQWREDLNRILGGFVRGQLLLALIIGAAAAVGCLLLGIGQWLLIGIVVVFASLIPVFGPYIGAVPAVFAALAAPPHGFLTPVMRAALVLVMFLVINEVGSKILYPRLVGAALGLHEVLVLFVLFAGWEVGHLWGVLFAAPLTALAFVTAAQLYRFWEGLPPTSVAQKAARGGEKAKAQGTP